MNAECFIDTNIFVYAIDPEAKYKHLRSLELIETADFGLSAQVLQEFFVTVTRKLAMPISPSDAMAYIDRLTEFPVVPIDSAVVVEGMRNSVKFQLSFWDGAILAAAQLLGASSLYTEDLNHGQSYGGVVAINPYC